MKKKNNSKSTQKETLTQKPQIITEIIPGHRPLIKQ